VINTAGTVGAFVGPTLGGPIFDAYGFPSVMAVDGVLLAAVVLGLSRGDRDNFAGSKGRPFLGIGFGSSRLVAASAAVLLLFVSMILVFSAWILPYTYVPLAVEALYHGDNLGTVVGLVVGASGLATLVCGPLAGSLADRWGVWRTLLGAHRAAHRLAADSGV